jgi:hypothetical protein
MLVARVSIEAGRPGPSLVLGRMRQGEGVTPEKLGSAGSAD